VADPHGTSGPPNPQEEIRHLRRQLDKLTGWLEDLMQLGEPPYSPAVFKSVSEMVDPRAEEARRYFNINPAFRKCWLITLNEGELVGTASKSLLGELQSGQLVLINGNKAVVAPVPEGEVEGIKGVIEGNVSGVLGDLLMVVDGDGRRSRGVILSSKLKKAIAEKPLQEGDRVLLFGPCILKILERKNIEITTKVHRVVRFSDIGGLDKEIRRLKDLLGIDISDSVRKALNLNRARGALLYGPPGCGKDTLVAALATEYGMFLQALQGAEIESKWVGVTEEIMRESFKIAQRNQPSIWFINEADALFPPRGTHHSEYKNDYISQFNVLVNGIEDTSGVFVIIATNRIDRIDPAVIRIGRVTDKIFIPRPKSREAASAILRVYFERHPVSGKEGDPKEAVEKWIAQILDRLLPKKAPTHLFTAFHKDGGEEKFYFSHFISGSLLEGIVDSVTLRAAKRLGRDGIDPEKDPAFGLASEDVDSSVVADTMIKEIPKDERQTGEWLLTNGYSAPEDIEFSQLVRESLETQ